MNDTIPIILTIERVPALKKQLWRWCLVYPPTDASRLLLSSLILRYHVDFDNEAVHCEPLNLE